MIDAEIADQLAGWGKIVIVETRGRITGRLARAGVGFVEQADGSLLMAAGEVSADWALNLQADPICSLRLESRMWVAVAELLAGPEQSMAIRELILKYGTPAERLGAGPAFRLRPAGGDSIARLAGSQDRLRPVPGAGSPGGRGATR